jgi:hypothetical protein
MIDSDWLYPQVISSKFIAIVVYMVIIDATAIVIDIMMIIGNGQRIAL